MYDDLFVAKFRPQSLDEILLPKRIKDEIGDGGVKQNYLFYGTQGTGKCVTCDTLIEVFDERTNTVKKYSITEFIKLCQL